MSSNRKRDDKSPTTFWMQTDLKKEAQEKARLINVTLTELINSSVLFFLKEGHKYDDDMGKKLAIADLTQNIRGSGIYDTKIAELEGNIKGMNARIAEMEDRITGIQTGEGISSIVQASVATKVDPLIIAFNKLLQQITHEAVSIEEDDN